MFARGAVCRIKIYLDLCIMQGRQEITCELAEKACTGGKLTPIYECWTMNSLNDLLLNPDKL